MMGGQVELTILMPCLNEANSVAFCVTEALEFLHSRGIHGQVLVADNGSTDGSGELARAAGADVVDIAEKGYGHALRGGIQAAQGEYIIMGDCDGSYDFSHLDEMLAKLRQDGGLVVGNRYLGGMEPGAMPFSHRCIGVPVLSWLGWLRWKVDVGDFHCGLRGFSRRTALALDLRCGGMEFATEIIGKAAAAGVPVCQVPAVLRRDRRNGPSHLRSIPDGWRHLKYILFWRQAKSG